MKKATLWTIEAPDDVHTFFPLLGFDPGTSNIGVAILKSERDSIDLCEIKMERDKDAVTRIMDMYFLLNDFSFGVNQSLVCVEGASFGNTYRQAELAEIRTAIALWTKLHGASKVQIVPPNTIRKTVFGKGFLAAHNVWSDKEIGRDALAALSCLYYADKMGK